MQMKFSDGESEFLRVFNFATLGNSRKLDARENIVFYSSQSSDQVSRHVMYVRSDKLPLSHPSVPNHKLQLQHMH